MLHYLGATLAVAFAALEVGPKPLRSGTSHTHTDQIPDFLASSATGFYTAMSQMSRSLKEFNHGVVTKPQNSSSSRVRLRRDPWVFTPSQSKARESGGRWLLTGLCVSLTGPGRSSPGPLLCRGSAVQGFLSELSCPSRAEPAASTAAVPELPAQNGLLQTAFRCRAAPGPSTVPLSGAEQAVPPRGSRAPAPGTPHSPFCGRTRPGTAVARVNIEYTQQRIQHTACCCSQRSSTGTKCFSDWRLVVHLCSHLPAGLNISPVHDQLF